MSQVDGPKVYLKDEAFAPPEGESVYYLLAGNGLFRVTNMPLYSATARVRGGIPGLGDQEETIRLNLPPVPRALIERAVGFFWEICDKYDSESILLLYYHEERGQYRLVAPRQTITLYVYPSYTVAKSEVEYESEPPPRGWRQVGSIHSHGRTPAFHSVQDQQDARCQNGLHIIVGSLDWKPDFCVVFAVGDTAFRMKLEDVSEGFGQAELPAPEEWHRRVHVETIACSKGPHRWGGGSDYGYGMGAPPAGYDGFGRRIY